jgi:hypothetical protein
MAKTPGRFGFFMTRAEAGDRSFEQRLAATRERQRRDYDEALSRLSPEDRATLESSRDPAVVEPILMKMASPNRP